MVDMIILCEGILNLILPLRRCQLAGGHGLHRNPPIEKDIYIYQSAIASGISDTLLYFFSSISLS